ncbi:MAG TPA: MFS transporter [Polyangiaceae bacterium]|nr:MFS transporter [Polyangiaceae bacterium]
MTKRDRLPLAVVLLGFTSLFTDVGTEMIFPLLPVFLTEALKAGPAYLGLVEGAADTVSSLLKLASGYIADRTKSRKPLVLFGYGLASAVRPFVALATKPWHVLAVRVTDRVGKGLRSSPRDALIADAAGDKVGRAFGFHQAMDNAGAVAGPLIATGLIAMSLSLRQVFWIAVIPGAIATLLVALVKEPPHPTSTSTSTSTSTPTSTPTPTRLFTRTLVSYLVILGVFSLGNSSDAFLLLRARNLGLTTAQIPVLWSVLNLSKVVWAYLGGDAADRIPRARLVAGGWAVYALVYLGLGQATQAWHVWALFVLYGVFYGLTEPVEKALVRDLAPPDQRGRAYGAYNFVVGVTALPAGLLMGVLWRVWGPAHALEVGAALAAVSGVALLLWDAYRRPR